MNFLFLLNVNKLDEQSLNAVLPLLPEERKERVLRYHFLKDRLTCAFSYLLLKQAYLQLGEDISSYKLKTEDNGKPYFEETKYKFSLSHSYPYIAAMLSAKDCGVDVEVIKDSYKGIPGRYFFAEEKNLVKDKHDFYRFWTLKEAASKINGEGIVLGLQNYDFADVFKQDSFNKYNKFFMIIENEKFVLSSATMNKENIIFQEVSVKYTDNQFDFVPVNKN